MSLENSSISATFARWCHRYKKLKMATIRPLWVSSISQNSSPQSQSTHKNRIKTFYVIQFAGKQTDNQTAGETRTITRGRLDFVFVFVFDAENGDFLFFGILFILFYISVSEVPLWFLVISISNWISSLFSYLFSFHFSFSAEKR